MDPINAGIMLVICLFAGAVTGYTYAIKDFDKWSKP
jgi:hypothetical protein